MSSDADALSALEHLETEDTARAREDARQPDPPLLRRLPPVEEADPDRVLQEFLAYVEEKGLELYPAQEEAVLEIASGKNVILSTPTGSGKSLVATMMHFLALAEGRRSVYTCPIKALVSEKFFALCAEFGPDSVGMLTGDAAVNRDAPILCCTAEILANMALRQGEDADADYVIMDEFHYFSDRDRGVAWQIPLLTLPRATFLLMSATLGPTERFEKKLEELTKRPVAVVKSAERPVPLDYEYSETPLHETVARLVRTSKVPAYLVNFTQRAAAEEAQNLMSVDFCSKEEKRAIAEELKGVRFTSPYGKDVQRFLRHGVGLHHAGLLPKYRLAVEKLAQKGLLKVISGTDTLGVGVNIPIRAVVFTKLCKFDGEKTALLRVRDFQQIAGRAGRKGFDTQGSVVAQAPEHVVENLRLEAKAGSDPVKKKRVVRKKPPERGYVHWDRGTFDKLVASPPEPLESRFSISHGMLLSVLGRPRGGCRAMKRLVKDSLESPHAKRKLKTTGLQMFRSLVEAGLVELLPVSEGGPVRVSADLQQDFSLHQALGLYLVETLPRLDPEAGTHALDMLTLVESILENPDVILQKQLDKLKTEKIAELKAAGVEYDERMAELEKLEAPKPNKDFVYATFNEFAKKHPWVAGDNIRPKSIAREMYENYLAFHEYVNELGLARAEGALLRYLTDVYKALVQSVPERDKTEELREIIAYFGAMVRGVDSSLLDEWERMRDGELTPRELSNELADERKPAVDVTRDARAFRVMIKNELYAWLEALAARDFGRVLESLDGAEGGAEDEAGEAWTAPRLEAKMREFEAEHQSMRLGPEARRSDRLRFEIGASDWRVSQVVSDALELDDWVLVVRVDLARSREAGRPVMQLLHFGA